MNSEIVYKKKILKDLKVIRDNFGYDNGENYKKLYDKCYDCESLYGEPYLADYIRNTDLLDEDDIGYHMEKIGKDLDRMRCFIGDTRADNIYKIDGYGNLANVTKSDLVDVCNDVIDLLKENIKSLQQAEL